MLDIEPVRTGVEAARRLADQVVDELDPAFWNHESTDPDSAAEIADYVVGALRGTATNLQSAAVELDLYRGLRQAHDSSIRLNMHRFGTPYPRPRGTAYDERDLRMTAAEQGFFVQFGSTFDTLAAAVIGVAGLALDVQHADFGWFLPIGANYPGEAENGRLFKSLASEGSAARDEQVKAVKALAAAIEASGPAGWVDWALGMRNTFVHREHRTEFTIIDHDKRTGTSAPRVPIANPEQSNIQAFRDSGEFLVRYYLSEDVMTTMSGLIGSLNGAVTATIEVLRHMWDRRKSEPGLVPQPSAQWKPRTKTFTFAGYEPGSAVIKRTATMLANPSDAARMKAAGLLTDR